VALGALAGIAFGAAAVASRPLASISISSANEFLTDPLLYLLVAHSLVGQLLLGLAMQRGSTTAAVAAMDAAAAVPAAIIGLLFLGDRIAAGREWMAAAGFVLTLGAVIGLTFFAEPQHHHTSGPGPVPVAAVANAATGVRRARAGGGVGQAGGSGARAKTSRSVRTSHARARVRRARHTARGPIRGPQN
jgi:hypothetical protein